MPARGRGPPAPAPRSRGRAGVCPQPRLPAGDTFLGGGLEGKGRSIPSPHSYRQYNPLLPGKRPLFRRGLQGLTSWLHPLREGASPQPWTQGRCGAPGPACRGGGEHPPACLGSSLGPTAGSSAVVHVLGSGAGGCTAALAAFLAKRNEAGMEIGGELEAPSVTAVPVGFVWTRLSGSG